MSEDEDEDEGGTRPASLTVWETLVLLRAMWRRGYVNDFDERIKQIKSCSLEEAEAIREKWMKEGLIGYDPDGWLTWT